MNAVSKLCSQYMIDHLGYLNQKIAKLEECRKPHGGWCVRKSWEVKELKAQRAELQERLANV